MKKLFVLALCASIFACKNEKPAEEKTETIPAETKTAPAEFADAKYTETGKQNSAAFASGDIDTWMSSFADNAVYAWNTGDSLSGKTAITDYWKKRRSEVIDSISFSNDIWLPIKVNEPQSVEAPGIWLLHWYKTTAKYKTGKSMTQWMHTATHFDANDKIDRVIQYSDRALINAATSR